MTAKFSIVARVCIISICTYGVLLSNESSFSLGPVLGIGTGRMNSPSLGEVMERKSSLETEIKDGAKSALPGLFLSAGGHVIWHISDRLEADISVRYTRLSNTIILDQMEDDSHEGEGLNEREKIESHALIQTSSLQYPISIRYTIPANNSFFVKAGAAVDILINSRITSEETVTEKEWENGTLVSNSAEYKKHSADIDEFPPSQFSLLLGGGHRFKLGRNYVDLSADMRIPLSGSEFYTTDRDFTDNTELNDIYSREGSTDARQDTGIRLDDFRYGSIGLTATYLFGKGNHN
ncbi:MAG: hypothetical protein ACQEQ4_08070 [Fibrobacterota bacterium]